MTPRLAGQLQVGLQPLGQPGAARPDADQRACPGSQQARARRAQQVGVQRFGVEASGSGSCMRCCRNCSRISAAAAASTSRAPCAQRLGRGVALVDLVHRQAEAAVQLAREALRAARCCRAARRRGGTARRPPARRAAIRAISAAMAAKRASPSRATVVSGVRRARQRVAAATPTRLSAEIESQERSAAIGVHGAAGAHACPASWLSMRGSMPSSDSALS